jgi:hypothetical protein
LSKRKSKVQSEALVLSEQALAFRVEDELSYTAACEMKRAIAVGKKKICAVLDPIIFKAHSTHKEAVKQKKDLLLPLEQGDAWLDRQILDYRRQLAEAETKVTEEAPAFLQEAPLVATAPKVEGVYARKVIKYRVTDINKVPREYLVVDNSRISATIKKFGATTKIPGIEIYQEETMVARS